MAVTDTDATERVEPEPLAAQDPSLSPVVDHSAVTTHSPVPKVVAHRAPATPADHVEREARVASNSPRSAGPGIGSSGASQPHPVC